MYRYLVIIFLLMYSPAPQLSRLAGHKSSTPNPYTLVSHTSKGSSAGTSVTTTAVSTLTANLSIIAVIDYAGSTANLPTDNQSNTYTLAVTITDGVSFTRARIYYKYNPTTNASVTASYSSTSSFCSIFFLNFSGAVASPLDQTATNSASGLGGAFTLSTGSITTSATNELMITVLNAYLENTTPSIDNGYTMIESVNGSGGINFGGGISYKFVTSIVTLNPIWTGNVNAVSGASVSAAHGSFRSH